MTGTNHSRSALIVVDMQNAFCTEGGSFVAAGLTDPQAVSSILSELSGLVGRARDQGVPVLFTRQFYPDDPSLWDSATRRRFRADNKVLARGSWDHAIIDELGVQGTDLIIDKPRYDAFLFTDLEPQLRVRGVERVVVAGALANVCVLLTAMGAWGRGFEFAVPADTTVARTQELKDFALQTLSSFGAVGPWRDVFAEG